MTTNINDEASLFPEQTSTEQASEAGAHATQKKAESKEKPAAAVTDDQEAVWKNAINEFNNSTNLEAYKRISEKMELLKQMKTGLEKYKEMGYSPEKTAEILTEKFKGHPVLANVSGRNVRDTLNPKNKKTNSKKTKP